MSAACGLSEFVRDFQSMNVINKISKRLQQLVKEEPMKYIYFVAKQLLRAPILAVFHIAAMMFCGWNIYISGRPIY